MNPVYPYEEGEIAHRAWVAAMGGKDRHGNLLMHWHQLTPENQGQWAAATTGALEQAASTG